MTQQQTGAVQARTGAHQGAADKCAIHHPKKSPLKFPFVASGLAPRDKKIDVVVGRLVDQTNGDSFPGFTLPFPDIYRWAIYFNKDSHMVLTDQFTLEVFGIAISAQGLVVAEWKCSTGMLKPLDLHVIDIAIGWPDSHDHTLCPSNFVPYGTYNDAGTIAVTLSGGVSATAESVQYVDGIWSAQFNAQDFPSTLPTAACNLDAKLTTSSGGTEYAGTKTDLVFQNC
jgi:hypothetical protein